MQVQSRLHHRGEIVATVSSVNGLQASIANAERQVQQDQSRVNQDASRLEQSRSQLRADKQELSARQDDSRQAQRKEAAATPAPAPAVRLDRAIENPPPSQQQLPAELRPAQPRLNSLGQTIGKLINEVA